MVDFSLQWHITQQCENHCLHCYMDNEQYDLSMEDFLYCLDSIQECEQKNDFIVSNVTLTGGDPLLNPEWYPIAKKLRDCQKQLSILGNPETLSRENLIKLSRLNLKLFQLSLDGTQDTHDRIRYNGSFEKTIKGIHLLSKYQIPVGIMHTVSNENENEICDLLDYLDSLNLSIYFSFDFVIETGHAQDNAIENSTNKIAFFSKYLAKKEELLKKGSKVYLHDKPSLLFTYKNYNRITYANLDFFQFGLCSGCGAGWKHVTILKKGEVMACRRLPIVIGNLFQNSFEDILINSPILRNLRSINDCGICSNCSFFRFCRGCPAETYAHFGSFYPQENQCSLFQNGHGSVTNDDSETEWDKLRRFNEILPDLCNSNVSLVKSMILLRDYKAQDSFIRAPLSWLELHNLSLSEKEIAFLLFQCLNAGDALGNISL